MSDADGVVEAGGKGVTEFKKDFDVLDFKRGSTPATGVVPCALARHIDEWSHNHNASGEGTGGDT